jgi:sugar lactone lactonase YvrE
VTAHQIKTIAAGFAFLECPRWHDDRIWVSDMHRGLILTLGGEGEIEQTIAIPPRPGGFGWLADGSLLAVSTLDRRIVRYRDGELTTHADLSAIGVTDSDLNDMVVDAAGRCYVGESAVNVYAWMEEHMPRVEREGVGALGRAPLPEAEVFAVHPDGTVRVAAGGLRFPNGATVDPVRGRYIVAETFGLRLSVFEWGDDGELGARETIDLGFPPDGISNVDRDGAVWVADPLGGATHRVGLDGQVTDTIAFEMSPYACELGGPDGSTLFACLAPTVDPEQTVKLLESRVDAVTVAVPAEDRK